MEEVMKRLQCRWLWMVAMIWIGGVAMISPRALAASVVIHIGPDVPNPPVYHYVYYPEEEVYYVPETHVYWWAVGGEWRSGPRVPDSIRLGGSVNLDVDGRDPWRHHEVIVKQYPGHRH
jgi:hypothetical protein